MTSTVRYVFEKIRQIRAPLTVSLITSFALAYPPQSVEVYRSVAQVFALQTTELGARTIEVTAGLGALTVLGFVIALATALCMSERRGARERNILPASLAAIPAIGASIGCLRGVTIPPTSAISRAAELALEDMLENRLEPMFSESLAVILNYNTHLYAMSGALVLLAVLLFTVSWLLAGPVASSIVQVTRGLTEGQRIAALAALPVAVIFGYVAAPDTWLIPAGPVAILAIFSLLLVIALGSLTMLADRLGIPIVGLCIAWVALLSVLGFNDANRIHATARPASSSGGVEKPPSLEEAFLEWFRSRPDRGDFTGKPYPVYIVAAQGGGIYAAYHAAMVLGSFQNVCPLFDTHTFAISAVSGGSIGAAVHVATANARPHAIKRKHVPDGCLKHAERPQWIEGEYSMVRLADRVLSVDLLSPLVYGMLFPDFVQLFVPFQIGWGDRARQLEGTLEKIVARDFAREVRYKRLNPGAENLISKPYSDHWKANGSLPALLLNTTEIASGRRRVISPFIFAGDELRFLPVWNPQFSEVPLSTAAVLSARFPWITPPGWYEDIKRSISSSPSPSQRNRLVDGGYFENSGVSTALDLIRSIKAVADKNNLSAELDIRLIVLTKGESANETFLGFDRLISPLSTLLSTMTARGYSTIRQAQRELNAPGSGGTKFGVALIELKDLGYPPPLGWRLSPVTALLIEAQNGRREECIPDKDGFQSKPGRFDADCVLQRISQDLQPLRHK